MMLVRATLTAVALSASLFAADVCGDCDGNSQVNVLDALAVAGAAAGTVPGIPGSFAACDVDSDGALSILDALSISRSSAGVPVTLNCTFVVLPPPPPPVPTHTFSHATPIVREWVQRTPASSPPARGMAAMAFDSGRNVTVLFGGSPDGGFSSMNDTWEYNGNNWVHRSSDISPSPRSDHAMAYDSARGVTVLFGGQPLYTPSPSGEETWEWDGVNWVERFPAVSPPSRGGHSMVYDSARGVTVLWGGDAFALYGYFDDSIWEWDGTTWTEQAPPAAPQGGYWHAMSYDEQRQKVVLLGGSHCPTLTQTWEWDGNDWTQSFPAAPPAVREQHDMVYDSFRNETILFGGSFTYYGNDTLAWDGSSWQQVPSSTAPQARGGHSMVFDSLRGKIVLFGAGDWYTTMMNDTWEF